MYPTIKFNLSEIFAHLKANQELDWLCEVVQDLSAKKSVSVGHNYVSLNMFENFKKHYPEVIDSSANGSFFEEWVTDDFLTKLQTMDKDHSLLGTWRGFRLLSLEMILRDYGDSEFHFRQVNLHK